MLTSAIKNLWVDSASSDNGSLVRVLTVRLLVKLRDQPIASADTVDSSRKLLTKILSGFSSATAIPNFHTYPSNVKIQPIYKAIDKFLMKEFGPKTALQRTVETQDDSYDTILISALRKELLSQSDVEATSVPSTQSDSGLTASLSIPSTTPSAQNSVPSAQRASHSLVPMQGVEDVQTARKSKG